MVSADDPLVAQEQPVIHKTLTALAMEQYLCKKYQLHPSQMINTQWSVMQFGAQTTKNPVRVNLLARLHEFGVGYPVQMQLCGDEPHEFDGP